VFGASLPTLAFLGVVLVIAVALVIDVRIAFGIVLVIESVPGSLAQGGSLRFAALSKWLPCSILARANRRSVGPSA
jgi:hypothetical protein